MALRYASRKNVETLISDLILAFYEYPVSFQKVPGLRDIELVLEEGNTFKTFTSVYAISLYIHARIHSQQKNRKGSDACFDKDLLEDDLLVWVLSTLLPTLRGVSQKAITRILENLAEKVAARSKKSISLGDLFVFGVLCFHPICFDVKDRVVSAREIDQFCQFVQDHPRVKGVLEKYTNYLKVAQNASMPYKISQMPFYITTAINYTNGSPHIGHAYESVVTDIIARYHEINGETVLFVTGTDEHGQKIASNAMKQGKEPIEICNVYSQQFVDLNKMLGIKYNKFIRTTSQKHRIVGQEIWKRAAQKGDIYLGTYVGWYNMREETFISETEAKASNYRDPVSGEPLDKMEEESYFFRMSKYQQELINYLEKNINFIRPAHRRVEVLQRLKQPLADLSCSRTNLTWGIPVPDDPRHVMYVWFDALANYLTALDFGLDSYAPQFWPASLHVIGKDITWFHCVIWPCILMSLSLELPKTVFAHGFVLAKDGSKMSKSLNNIVDPFQVVRQFGSPDPFRFYLVFCGEVDRDLKFDTDAMHTIYNSELADTVGNLVHRATGLCNKYCEGSVPHIMIFNGSVPFDFRVARWLLFDCFERFMLNEALNYIMSLCRDVNKYLTDKAPWSISDGVERIQVCRILLEAIYYIAHFLYPFIPETAETIFHALHTPQRTLGSLSGYYDNLLPMTLIDMGEVLFKKINVKNG